MRDKCFITDCKRSIEFEVKMLVQHPTCKRWQTWRVCQEDAEKILDCKTHMEKDNITIDLFNSKTWYYYVIYKSKNITRPVIQIGSIQPLVI